MNPDVQRTVAAWTVILLGFVGCGVAFTLIDGTDADLVLGTYASGIAMAVAAGAVPLPGASVNGIPSETDDRPTEALRSSAGVLKQFSSAGGERFLRNREPRGTNEVSAPVV